MRTLRALSLFVLLATTVACSLATDLNGFTTTPPAPDASGLEPGDGGAGTVLGPDTGAGAPDATGSPPINCTAPSFCDAFDKPTLDPAWERAEEGGTLGLDSSSGRSSPGSLLLSLPANPGKASRRAVLSRNGLARPTHLRCRFAMRVDDVVGDPDADIETFKIGQTHPSLPNQSFGIAVSRATISLFERGSNDSFIMKPLGPLTLEAWTAIEIDTDFKTVTFTIDGKQVLVGEKVEEVVFNTFYVDIGAAFDTEDAMWKVRFDDLSCEISP